MGTHGGKAGRAAKVDYNLLRSTGFLPCRGNMQGKKGERRIACAKPLCFRRSLWSQGRIRLWKKLGVAVEESKGRSLGSKWCWADKSMSWEERKTNKGFWSSWLKCLGEKWLHRPGMGARTSKPTTLEVKTGESGVWHSCQFYAYFKNKANSGKSICCTNIRSWVWSPRTYLKARYNNTSMCDLSAPKEDRKKK